MSRYGTLAERFWRKVERKGPDECWPWKAAVSGGGYGLFRNGRMTNAHRVAWEIDHDRPVDSGYHVLHSCDNRRCCNPAHLRLGTPKDNAGDMLRRGRQGWKKLDRVG